MPSRRDQRREHDRARRKAEPWRAWYSSARWARLRKAFLSQPENAVCAYCRQAGRVSESEIVDHDPPHKGDPARFWSGPFIGLCKPCHDGIAKSRDMTGRIRGCDVNGMPLDPAHSWIAERK